MGKLIVLWLLDLGLLTSQVVTPEVRWDPPTHLVNSVGMQLVLVPPTTFRMGWPPTEETGFHDHELQHQVTLSHGYYLGVHEVTQDQYAQVMGVNPSFFQGVRLQEPASNTGQTKAEVDGSHYPVDQISWEDAVEFCRRLSQLPAEKASGRVYRLPTEAEWEGACRAGKSSAFHFGDDVSSLGDYAWYNENSRGRPHPVGQKKPNPLGLYDMHGNVYEWCADGYGPYPHVPVIDPMGSIDGALRVLRGGSWLGAARHCRSATRVTGHPQMTNRDWGFRVALSPPIVSPAEGRPKSGEQR